MAKKPAKKKVAKKEPKKTESIDYDYSFLDGWSKKLEKTTDELKEEILEIATELKVKHKGKDELWILTTSRRRVYAKYKKEFKSTATYWIICPLYASQPNNYGAKHYERNLKDYQIDPLEAKKDGKVRIEISSDGRESLVIPLEEREEKKAHTKKLPKNAWLQTIGGITMPFSAYEEDDWSYAKPFVITLFSPFADPTNKQFIGDGFNCGLWYKCKVTNNTKKIEDATKWLLNATSLTNWDSEFKDMELLSESDITAYYDENYTTLGGLNDYHEAVCELNEEGNKSYTNHLVVTKGLVIDITIADEDSNSHRITIDDEESLGFGDDDDKDIPDSITVWINKENEIDFSINAEILVFGKTSRSMEQDYTTKEYTGYWNSTTISSYGVIVTYTPELDIENEVAGDGENESVEIPDEDDGKEIPQIEEKVKEPKKQNKKKPKW